MKHTFPL